MDGLTHDVESLQLVDASLLQNATLKLLVKSAGTVDLDSYHEVKLVNEVDDGSISSTVPKDQWTVEIRAMGAYLWSTMQVLVADYAIGPGIRTPALSNYVVAPETAGEKQLCASQRMRKTGRIV